MSKPIAFYTPTNRDWVVVQRDGMFGIEVGSNPETYTRAELTELRHIIDQALNTSAEELNDDVA